MDENHHIPGAVRKKAQALRAIFPAPSNTIGLYANVQGPAQSRAIRITMTSIASLLPTFQTLVSAGQCPDSVSGQDLTDPAECPDMLGTTCKLHGSARFLDEAPLVHCHERTPEVVSAKHRFFPNSWTGIVSYSTPPGGFRLFGSTRRKRLVVVRYCPVCREAANHWFAATHDTSKSADGFSVRA